MWCVAVRCVAVRCVAVRCVAVWCVAVWCVAVRRVAVWCVAVRCVVVWCVVGRWMEAAPHIVLHCEETSFVFEEESTLACGDGVRTVDVPLTEWQETGKKEEMGH